VIHSFALGCNGWSVLVFQSSDTIHVFWNRILWTISKHLSTWHVLFVMIWTFSIIHTIIFNYVHGLKYLIFEQILIGIISRREEIFFICFLVLICLLIFPYWYTLIFSNTFLVLNPVHLQWTLLFLHFGPCKNFLFGVCPTPSDYLPARFAADTNTYCSDFHITQKPYS